MADKILFKSESVQNCGEIGIYLRQIGDSLDAGGDITLRAGDQSVAMDSLPSLTVDAKAEREGPTGNPGELSAEFELEWGENGGGSGQLEIE
jgi:amphi-Trp domain-containing protein